MGMVESKILENKYNEYFRFFTRSLVPRKQFYQKKFALQMDWALKSGISDKVRPLEIRGARRLTCQKNTIAP